MPRFFPRFLPSAFRGIKLQRTFPVLFIALVLPSDRRRQRTSPLVFSSVKSLAGITSMLIPQIPIPDTSKLKEALLNVLPSWTTDSATSRFVRRPQADIVVGITIEMQHFVVAIGYYPKGEDIVIRSNDDEDAEIGWVDLRRPRLAFITDWQIPTDNVTDPLNHTTIRYTTSYPHQPIGVGHSRGENRIKRWDPDRDWFFVSIDDFIFSDERPLPNRGNKPPTFTPTKRQVMTDFARLIRERVESFLANDILDNATIVNETPVIKYLVSYPDILDGVDSGSGALCIRDFTIAFKNAGFPMLDSDIQPIPAEDEDPEDDEVILKDVLTSSRMVEFLSVGLTGLIGYANVMPGNPQIPAIPKERPFVTVVDDEAYFTSRLCLMTNDSRFGVVQEPTCHPIRSPAHKMLPDEHITLLMNMFAKNPEGADNSVEWRRILNENPGLEQKNFLHGITNWPEHPARMDVVNVLKRALDKTFVELEAEPMPPPEGDGLPHKVSASCVAFAKMVEQAIRTPILESLEDSFIVAPSMTDVALFDTGAGEHEIYKAFFELIHIPKSLPPTNWVKKSAAEPHYVLPDQTGLEHDSPQPSTAGHGDPPDGHFFEGPDWAKFAERAREDPELMASLSKDDLDYIKYLTERRRPINYNKYYNMRVMRPQDHGLNVPIGMCEAINAELARIYVEALRV
ncbi:hypothetical protein TWF696_009003 [Orbilia brochopaga]|uniref:Uncharacterized protein n=1 Tax=Orbilia brochopaga TaxID=3140254 RepID=A0AAV9UHK0_9PEZI